MKLVLAGICLFATALTAPSFAQAGASKPTFGLEVFNNMTGEESSKDMQMDTGGEDISVSLKKETVTCTVSITDIANGVATVGVELSAGQNTVLVSGNLNPHVPGIEEKYDELHVRLNDYACIVNMRL